MIMTNARCCTLKPVQHRKAIFLQFKNKKKMCVYRMECYLSTKKNEILPFTVT